jgi:hypothetical protein
MPPKKFNLAFFKEILCVEDAPKHLASVQNFRFFTPKIPCDFLTKPSNFLTKPDSFRCPGRIDPHCPHWKECKQKPAPIFNTELTIHALDQVHCWDAYFHLRIGHYENFTPLNF